MRTFLTTLLRSVRSDAWRRGQMIRDVGIRKWLGHEWAFVRFAWSSRDDREIARSAMTVGDIFFEMRMNFDVTGTVSRWELIEFARLSGCEDLMEEARMSAEEYRQRVESQGGKYPLEGLRRTWLQQA